MLKISSLEALRAFVECGSVSLAAVRLGRTQPQVGRLLSGLEESLGFSLFHRERKRLSLTPEGVRFYQNAERVLAGHDGLGRVAGEIRAQQRDSHLRLLTAPQVVSSMLGEALTIMAARRPDFTAMIDSRVRLDADAVVGQEHFDLGVTVPPLSHPGLTVEPLCEVEAVVVMRKDHPLAQHKIVTLEALVQHDLIATNPRSLLRREFDYHARHAGIVPHFRFEAANGVVVCQMAALGLGVALADPFVARSSPAPGLVMRLFQPAIALPYGLFYPVWQPRSATAVEFTSIIYETVQREKESLMRNLRRGAGGSKPA